MAVRELKSHIKEKFGDAAVQPPIIHFILRGVVELAVEWHVTEVSRENVWELVRAVEQPTACNPPRSEQQSSPAPTLLLESPPQSPRHLPPRETIDLLSPPSSPAQLVESPQSPPKSRPPPIMIDLVSPQCSPSSSVRFSPISSPLAWLDFTADLGNQYRVDPPPRFPAPVRVLLDESTIFEINKIEEPHTNADGHQVALFRWADTYITADALPASLLRDCPWRVCAENEIILLDIRLAYDDPRGVPFFFADVIEVVAVNGLLSALVRWAPTIKAVSALVPPQ